MKPYFETELGKLYHGRFEDILPFMPVFDLVLTDPPYGIGESGKQNSTRGKLATSSYFGGINYDNDKLPDSILKLMLSHGENQIVFGGNYYGSVLGDTPCYLVWDKGNGNTDFADCELAWTSFKTATRIIKYRWHGMLQENMAHKEKRVYPGQKPVGLFKWVLDKYASKKDTVCDPCCGSGTTAIACEDRGIRWVAIDKLEIACEIAAKRIDRETQQLKLFRGQNG